MTCLIQHHPGHAYESMRSRDSSLVPRIGNKSDYILVDHVWIGRAHPVWETRIDLERRVLYQLCRQEGRVCNRDDLIVTAVENKRWDIDLL